MIPRSSYTKRSIISLYLFVFNNEKKEITKYLKDFNQVKGKYFLIINLLY